MVLSDHKPEGIDKDAQYRLFVAAANTNNVFVVSVSDTKDMKLTEIDQRRADGAASAGHDAERRWR